MFCPECHAEYRQGFTRCADCDIDLVYQLPPEPRSPSATPSNTGFDDPHSELRLIWRGNSEAWCVSTCRQLLKSDIPYRVAQIAEGPDFDMRPNHRYEIGVASADYQRAKDLLGFEGEFEDATYNPDEEEDDANGPQDTQPIVVDHDPADPGVRNDAYLEPWYPEDAIVEVWSQDAEDFSGAIEMAFKEHLIRCRIACEDRVHKIFVLPQDEARARQIVREITDGIEL
jgi:hypothetical protein